MGSAQLDVSHPPCPRIAGCVSDGLQILILETAHPRQQGVGGWGQLGGHRVLSCLIKQMVVFQLLFPWVQATTHPHFLEDSLAVEGGRGL